LEALLLLAQNADRDGIRGEAFNVTSEIPRTTLEVMQSYLEAAGRSDLSPIVEEAAPGELSAKVSSSNKIFERLGWKESTPFDVGLREVISRA
jgi:nucleoside-diphosphate-sugar epimerase